MWYTAMVANWWIIQKYGSYAIDKQIFLMNKFDYFIHKYSIILT